MEYYSINDRTRKATLKEALFRSMVEVSDLYMPVRIPTLPSSFFQRFNGLTFREIALEVSLCMFGKDIPAEVLNTIIREAYTFDVPLKQLSDNLYVLELFHGPTLAFKDLGARFMAGLFEYLNKDGNNEIYVLTATSGDTGSAVANAFFRRKGIRVIILYPAGKVSRIQEKQLTTMGENICTLEINGTFDNCQSLVKKAFADKELNTGMTLTSANSINFARLFPQSFYYFKAVSGLGSKSNIAISVPSGNFGNLTAGLIAKKMGLPVKTFIAATNINHAVPDYLETGLFKPLPTRHTITNAMDVGNPSNLPRILDLYNNNIADIRKDIRGYWFTDAQTNESMNELNDKFGYQADPHGAVAYLGIREYTRNNDCTGIFLETAHPAKFPDIVEKATGRRVEIPSALDGIMKKEGRSIRLKNDYSEFKEFLRSL
jgi:threonine synthase